MLLILDEIPPFGHAFGIDAVLPGWGFYQWAMALQLVLWGDLGLELLLGLYLLLIAFHSLIITVLLALYKEGVFNN